MANGSDLHELIHSLEQSERRRFLSGQAQPLPSDNPQHRIFFAIEAESSFNDEALRRQFAPGTAGNAWAMRKSYLYENILGKLSPHALRNETDTKLRRQLDDAAFLRRKGLYHQAMKRLRSAWKLAQKMERFAIIYELQFEMLRIHSDTNLPRGFQDFVTDILPVSRQALASQSDMQDIFESYARFSARLKTHGQLIYKNLQEPPGHFQQLAQRFPFTSVRANCLFLLLKGLIYSAMDDLDAAVETREQLAVLFDPHPHLLQDQYPTYFANLCNLVQNYLRQGRPEKATAILQKMKAENLEKGFRNDKRMREIQRMRLSSVEFQVKMEVEADEAAIAFAEALPDTIDALQTGLGREHLLSIRMFQLLLYMQNARFQKALRFLRKLRQELPGGFREDYKEWMMLAELLLLYRTGDHDFLPYQCTNALRHWQKKRTKFPLQIAFIRLFQQLPGARTKPETQELIRKFEALVAKGPAKPLPVYQTLFGWLRMLS